MTVAIPESDPLRFRFTDQDVREKPQYIDLVEQFLIQYEGEFDFLRKMRRCVLTGEGLTIGMVRGVLNCMRSDARGAAVLRMIATNQPIPVLPKPEIVIEPDTPSNVRYLRNFVSDHTEDHPAPIKRRQSVKLPLSVNDKYLYVKGRTGSLIHTLAGGGVVHWWPKDDNAWLTPRLAYYLKCKHPGTIYDGKLYGEMPSAAEMELMEVGPCPHCAKAE